MSLATRQQPPLLLDILYGHTDVVYCAVPSKDDRYLVTCSHDLTASIWQTRIQRVYSHPRCTLARLLICEDTLTPSLRVPPVSRSHVSLAFSSFRTYLHRDVRFASHVGMSA